MDNSAGDDQRGLPSAATVPQALASPKKMKQHDVKKSVGDSPASRSPSTQRRRSSRRRTSTRDGPRRFSMYTESHLLLPDPPASLAPASPEVNEALCVAAWRCNLEVVTTLIEQKRADLKYVDGHGWAALHWSALTGDRSVCDYLCEKGADPNHPDLMKRWTPVHVAASQGHVRAIKCFTNHDANLNARDYKDRTPLWLACHRGDVKMVRELLLLGASKKINDAKGRQPGIKFAFTVSRTRRRWVRELLEANGKISGLEYRSWWSQLCCVKHKVFIYLEDPPPNSEAIKEPSQAKLNILQPQPNGECAQQNRGDIMNFFQQQPTVTSVRRAISSPSPIDQSARKASVRYPYLRKHGVENIMLELNSEALCKLFNQILQQIHQVLVECKRAQLEVFYPDLLKWCKSYLQLCEIVIQKMKGLSEMDTIVIEKMLQCANEETKEFAEKMKHYREHSLLIGFVGSNECKGTQFEIIRHLEAILSVQNDGVQKTRAAMPDLFSDDSLRVQSVKSEDDFAEEHSIRSTDLNIVEEKLNAIIEDRSLQREGFQREGIHREQPTSKPSNNEFDDHRKNSIPEEVADDSNNPASSSSTENDHSSKEPIDFDNCPSINRHHRDQASPEEGSKQLFDKSHSASHHEKDAVRKKDGVISNSNQFASRDLKMVSIP